MMISARFSQPPSQSEGALLYRRGLQTMDTVRQAIASLEVQSDRASDLNRSDQLVVVSDPVASEAVLYQLEGLQPRTFTHISGTLRRGEQPSLEADLRDPSSGISHEQCHVSYQETADEKIYKLGMLYQEGSPGTVTVREIKGQEGFIFEQERDFDGILDTVPTEKIADTNFSTDGPTTAEDAPLWQAASALIQRVESNIETARALDNGPDDLCAAPGHLVVANFGTVESDNEKRPAGWGLGSEEFVWKKATHYPVILEAKLEFNPKTGAAKSFNAGFAKHSVMSFEQSGDVQRFQQTKEDEKGGYLIVDRAANGDLHVQSFASTRQETLDQKARQAEQSAPRRGFFSRFIFG